MQLFLAILLLELDRIILGLEASLIGVGHLLCGLERIDERLKLGIERLLARFQRINLGLIGDLDLGNRIGESGGFLHGFFQIGDRDGRCCRLRRSGTRNSEQGCREQRGLECIGH